MFHSLRTTSSHRPRVSNRARLLCQRLEARTTPATFTVINNADGGAGSLRQALSDANTLVGTDTIAFSGVVGTITLTSGELTISDAVTINGPGAGALTVSGNNAGRIFNTQTAPTKAAIAITGLTMAAGKVTGSGGAIFVGDESLTLTNCVVTGSSASTGGGAIYVRFAAGFITVQSSTVSNNTATGEGGGILTREASPVVVLNSSVSGNTASSNGGGISHYSPGSMRLENSTFSGNKSGNVGGGFIARGANIIDEAIIRNCTISGNTALRGGGFALRTPIIATVQGVTVIGNTASQKGGGLAVVGSKAVVSIESAVLSSNTNSSSPDIDGDGLTSNTINLATSAIGSNLGFAFVDKGGNLPFGLNLKLGPLADNGGPTKTHAPAFDSPLVNAGSNPAAIATDQRGPGYARTGGAKTDIGAVEIPIFIVTNADDSGKGSLRQALLDANALAPSTDQISFDPVFFSVPRTILLSGELPVSDSVAIIGPGSNLLVISGNSVGRVLNVNGGTGSLAVNISGLTITNGKSGGPGGGIFNQDESLVLTDCVITGNQSAQAGGGIFVHSGAGSLTLLRCTVSNNQVTSGIGQKVGDGGGIEVLGASIVVIDSSSITGNTAKENGGGLYFFSGGSLTLTNSTLSGNVAKAGSGGAVYFTGNAVALTIRNSTVSGNSAQLNGGGLYLPNFLGTALIQNSTVANNTATTGIGGGIARGIATGTIALESAIVAGNVSAGSPDIDSAGTVTAKTSAIGSNTGFTLTSQGGNLAFGVDLKLGTLASNGGLTQTHLPLAGSPLVNVGSNPASLTNDQRGTPRTVLGQVDIGAVEVQDLIVTNTANAGPGSLRQAIADANTLFPGSNTVTFDITAFATAQVITLTTGEIAITEALAIVGTGSAKLTVSGNSASRLFSIDKSTSSGNAIAISGVTLTGGKSTAAGGAIFNNDEALTLTDCVVTGNQSTVSGGGIFVLSALGSLTLQDCTVSNNQVTAGVGLKAGDGGGINLQGASKVTIDRSTLSGNTANENGGAIYFYQGGSLTLTNSTISGNTAKALQGGGIFFYGTVTASGLTLRSSTVAGNTAKTSGGGLWLVNLTGTCVIQNSTIAYNVAQTGFGGGIARVSGSGSVALESSIVSGNSNVNAPDIYSSGSVFAKFTAFGNATGFTFTDQGNNLPIPANLKLGSLANSGGPTQTIALLAGSPGIDAGSNAAGLSNDQRGPGFARVVGSAADIGAFEVQPAHVQSVVVNGGAVQRSRVTTIAITFDANVALPANPETAFQLKRQSDNLTPTLGASVDNSGPGTVVTLTFTGTTAVEFGSLADGRYTLTAIAAQIGNFDGNGDGITGDDFVLVGDPAAAPNLFRLFGDSDGDGDVDNTDFVALRLAFGSGPSIFDADGDGDTDNADFVAFRARFGTTLP